MAKSSKMEHALPKFEEPAAESAEIMAPGSPAKQYAKSVELGLGVHLLGTVLALRAQRGTKLEIREHGIMAISGKNARRVFVPWTNIKAYELMPDEPVKPKAA